jgi:putative addiction module component (TIGR02574 family)
VAGEASQAGPAIVNPAEDRIIREALKLSPEARAALAGALLDSLESAPDPDAEAAWGTEIRARIAELDQGRVQTVPWSEARRALLGG